ncbi:hypothetical protein HYH02_001350 [Chlamydomonas schloesseri]|uniref:Protein kinase domain-containing protein n=1 Tax=Chlamydomonas schloesseri TaxID=2026947 RepID=A0A835WW85_9CHLO|nr:hypothetical protein HYH02_001350 [Chlamydomonas schloesseri]|eukprot:KAG2454323.1 hypothetical protein HYH02_001350 [Chlamydomonas schloesseri]
MLVDVDWIVISDADYVGLALPIVLRRNVTVLGARTALERYPVFDFQFVRAKVKVPVGVVLTFKRFMSERVREAANFQAPGFDLITDNFHANYSNPLTPLGLVVFEDGVTMHRACLESNVSATSVATLPRPPTVPGKQAASPRSLPPSPPGCVNSSAAGVPLAARCLPPVGGMYGSVATYGLSLDGTGKGLRNGYLALLQNLEWRCYVLMTQQCMAERGVVGCFYYHYPMGSYNPAAVYGTNGSVAVPQQAPPPASDGGPSAALLGGVIGGVLGGVLLLGVGLAGFLLLRRRRRARRDAAHPAALSKGLDSEGGQMTALGFDDNDAKKHGIVAIDCGGGARAPGGGGGGSPRAPAPAAAGGAHSGAQSSTGGGGQASSSNATATTAATDTAFHHSDLDAAALEQAAAASNAPAVAAAAALAAAAAAAEAAEAAAEAAANAASDVPLTTRTPLQQGIPLDVQVMVLHKPGGGGGGGASLVASEAASDSSRPLQQLPSPLPAAQAPGQGQGQGEQQQQQQQHPRQAGRGGEAAAGEGEKDVTYGGGSSATATSGGPGTPLGAPGAAGSGGAGTPARLHGPPAAADTPPAYPKTSNAGSSSYSSSTGGGTRSAVVTLLPTTIGKGSFGRVVEGLFMGQPVAVKLLNTGLLGDDVDMEAALAAGAAAAEEAEAEAARLAGRQPAAAVGGEGGPGAGAGGLAPAAVRAEAALGDAAGAGAPPMPHRAGAQALAQAVAEDAAKAAGEAAAAAAAAAGGEAETSVVLAAPPPPEPALALALAPATPGHSGPGDHHQAQPALALQQPVSMEQHKQGQQQQQPVAAAAATAARGNAKAGGPGASDASSKLSQEIQVLARVRHPNIIKLLAANPRPPMVCLVMERMDTSLDKMMYGGGGGVGGGNREGAAGQRPMPMAKVVHIALQIARALAYLHPYVLHRDLKPANVLISGADTDRPVAKLADFGLARLRDTVLVTQHPEVGTWPYMAPETFDASNFTITDRSDCYSFGVLLWEMVTGLPPWKGLTMVVVAYIVTVMGKRLPPEPLAARGAPHRLIRLIQQCFEPDPLRRPAAAELVKGLLLVQEQLQQNDAMSQAYQAAMRPV